MLTGEDAEKVNLVADWIDMKYTNDVNREVQTDLRRIARDILDVALKTKETT